MMNRLSRDEYLGSKRQARLAQTRVRFDTTYFVRITTGDEKSLSHSGCFAGTRNLAAYPKP